MTVVKLPTNLTAIKPLANAYVHAIITGIVPTPKVTTVWQTVFALIVGLIPIVKPETPGMEIIMDKPFVRVPSVWTLVLPIMTVRPGKTA